MRLPTIVRGMPLGQRRRDVKLTNRDGTSDSDLGAQLAQLTQPAAAGALRGERHAQVYLRGQPRQHGVDGEGAASPDRDRAHAKRGGWPRREHAPRIRRRARPARRAGIGGRPARSAEKRRPDAAATDAVTRAEVRSLVWQQSSVPARSVTRPVIIAASIPAEWWCAPAGARESSSRSSRALFTAGRGSSAGPAAGRPLARSGLHIRNTGPVRHLLRLPATAWMLHQCRGSGVDAPSMSLLAPPGMRRADAARTMRTMRITRRARRVLVARESRRCHAAGIELV
jgi:hypothetical protein